jgi:hypothetical protein
VDDRLRLAELLVGLSMVNDAGVGQEPGTAARACLLVTAFARALDLPEPEVSDVYYTALMQHVGCAGYAHEAAALLGGDEIAVKAPALRAKPAPVSGFARQVQEGYSCRELRSGSGRSAWDGRARPGRRRGRPRRRASA